VPSSAISPPPSPPASPANVRVLVLADVRLYREGLAQLLAGHPGLTVVGGEAVTADALARVRAERVDVVVLEAATACDTTIVHDLARTVPDAKVVAFGVVDEERQVLRCAEVGVAAFASRDASGRELAEAILGVGRGECSLSPRMTALLLRRLRALAERQPGGPGQDRLTPREQRIVALIAEGLSNKEIATRLGIELCTVKNHVHHILEKLRVTRRTQAVARLRRGPLLPATAARGAGSGSNDPPARR
jgi:two-component system, NarL family, nitrate/nitrite response regulator NarL